MDFFSKSIATETTNAETRLLIVENEWRRAEATYARAGLAVGHHNALHADLRTQILDGSTYRLLSGPARDPIRQQLERARDASLAKRNALLAERAQLMRDLNLIR